MGEALSSETETCVPTATAANARRSSSARAAGASGCWRCTAMVTGWLEMVGLDCMVGLPKDAHVLGLIAVSRAEIYERARLEHLKRPTDDGQRSHTGILYSVEYCRVGNIV